MLNKLEIEYSWDYNDDMHTQYFELNREPRVNFEEIAIVLIPNVDEIVCASPKWLDGYQGLLQLVVLIMLSEKLKEEL